MPSRLRLVTQRIEPPADGHRRRRDRAGAAPRRLRGRHQEPRHQPQQRGEADDREARAPAVVRQHPRHEHAFHDQAGARAGVEEPARAAPRSAGGNSRLTIFEPPGR